MSNTSTRYVAEKKYRLEEATIKSLFLYNSGLRGAILIVNSVLLIIAIGLIYITNNIDAAGMLLTVIIANIVILFSAIVLSINKKEEKEQIVPNNSKHEYLWNIGSEVKEFKGSGIKSLEDENLTGKKILISAETAKRMGGIIGTIGSGKTFQLNGFFEQQVALGGGSLTIDGKGTIEQLKTAYAIVGKYDRLDEFYVLNFADQNNTNSIGFLNSGNALILTEILSELIEKSDPQWDGVAINVISNILKLLVYKRDNENMVLSFDIISEYMSLTRLVEEAIKYKSKTKDDVFIRDFVNYVCVSTNFNYEQFLTKNDNKTHADILKSASNTKIQGVYNFTTAAAKWNEILTVFGSNYKNIFGVADPDIDLLDIVQTNKIVWVVLPTMESEETSKKIGKMFLGITKATANSKIKKGLEPKIPFAFFFDEYGSYGVIGFARFISKARSLGMPVWLYFQTIAQLNAIDNGKGIERQELLDNLGTLLVMKNNDPDLIEALNKRVPEIIELERFMTIKRIGANVDDLHAEKNLSKEKRDAFRAELFNGLSDGEMVTFIGNRFYKTVAQAHEDFSLTFDKLNLEPKFNLPKTYPKYRLSIDEFIEKKEFLITTKNKKYLFSDKFF